MTYFIDFIKNLTKKSNVGVLVYLILNTLIVIGIFYSMMEGSIGILFGLILYAISLFVALSPVGEWVLRMQLGCKKIKRKEFKNRLEPLFNEVYIKAKKVNPAVPDNVQLFMNNDEAPNAFATGRRTVCLTRGFLSYSDEEIKSVFAHELGHLANKDTDLVLMITVGNFIVTTIFIIYRAIVWFFTITISMFFDSLGSLITGFLTDVILGGVMWLWTKLGIILIMNSSRQSEYLADEFAFKCGYGEGLAAVLDTLHGSSSKGVWANLASSHPDSDDRIARLQDLGVEYVM